MRNVQAATTTAVILIPQAMAYALLAGLPPLHGLYAALLPLVAYALLGGSRQLSPGPGAMDSLLVGAALAGMHLADDAARASTAAVLALMVAAIQLALGALRAGFLVNFLSKPVISGFTSAAALMVALSQAPNLLGLPRGTAAKAHELVQLVLSGLPQFHGPTAMVGLMSIAALILLKKWRRRFPAPLVVVALSIALSAAFGLGDRGVATVGSIPAGLPALVLPSLPSGDLLGLLPVAFTLAFLGYMTVISIGQTFAQRLGYRLKPGREFMALGVANLAAGLSQAFPVSSSFSRSAVNAEAGANSPRTQLFTAAWVALTLLFLTPLLSPLPTATLAAVIITAVLGLVDFPVIRRLAKVKRADMWLLLFTFLSTLTLGIELGIPAGVAASLMLFLFRTTRPHWALLGRLGDSTDFRNVRNHPHARTYPGLLLLRIDAQFYFGNVTFLQDTLQTLEAQATEPIRAVVLEACSLNQLDSSANDALHALVDDYQKRGIAFRMASVKEPVAQVMRASGLWDLIGAQRIHLNLHDAVAACLAEDGVDNTPTPPSLHQPS